MQDTYVYIYVCLHELPVASLCHYCKICIPSDHVGPGNIHLGTVRMLVDHCRSCMYPLHMINSHHC